MRHDRFRPTLLLALLVAIPLGFAACDTADTSRDVAPADAGTDDGAGPADHGPGDQAPATDDGVTADVPLDVPGDDATADGPDADPPDAADGTDADPADAADVPPDVPPDVNVPACVGAPGTGTAWPTDASAAFLRGPFVQDVRDSHAYVVFRPATPVALQGCASWSIEGVASAIPASACADPDAYGQYAVRIDDLPADTAITYSVAVGDALAAGPFVFRSAPPPDRPQRILMMSDLHANPEAPEHAAAFSKLALQGLANGIDFAVTTGDNIDHPEEIQYDALFEGLRPLLHRVPLFASLGNHDSRNENYFEAFVLPQADPPDPAAPEMYYSYRRGNTFIASLEIFDWQLSWTFGESLGQVEWLRKELDSPAAKSARWRLLLIHEPPWGKNWNPCDPVNPNFGEQSLRDLLVPMAIEKGVSAIFSGHFHDYEHYREGGLDTFVLGGAGGGLEGVICTPPEGFPVPLKEISVHHSLTVDTGCTELTITATDTDGNLVDQVVLPYTGN